MNAFIMSAKTIETTEALIEGVPEDKAPVSGLLSGSYPRTAAIRTGAPDPSLIL